MTAWAIMLFIVVALLFAIMAAGTTLDTIIAYVLDRWYDWRERRRHREQDDTDPDHPGAGA